MAGVDPIAGLNRDPSLNRLLEVGDQTSWIRVEINNDKFVKSQEGKATGSLEGDFAAVAATLGAGPCYVLLRARPERWVCLVFLPASGKPGPSPQNRLYAASAAALQCSVVGEKGKIASEYVFDDKGRCRIDLWIANEKLAQNPLLTVAERTRMDYQVHGPEPLQPLDLPECKFDDAVAKAITGFKSGAIQTVFLSLNPENFSFVVDHTGSTGLEVPVAKFLTGEHPEFVLHKIADVRQQGAMRDVFLFFVPKRAPQRLKMIYAMSKGALLKHLEPMAPFAIECWKVRQVTPQAILDELYPKLLPPPIPAKKPKRPGKGRARLVGHNKFTAESVRIHTPRAAAAKK